MGRPHFCGKLGLWDFVGNSVSATSMLRSDTCRKCEQEEPDLTEHRAVCREQVHRLSLMDLFVHRAGSPLGTLGWDFVLTLITDRFLLKYSQDDHYSIQSASVLLV